MLRVREIIRKFSVLVKISGSHQIDTNRSDVSDSIRRPKSIRFKTLMWHDLTQYSTIAKDPITRARYSVFGPDIQDLNCSPVMSKSEFEYWVSAILAIFPFDSVLSIVP